MKKDLGCQENLMAKAAADEQAIQDKQSSFIKTPFYIQDPAERKVWPRSESP